MRRYLDRIDELAELQWMSDEWDDEIPVFDAPDTEESFDGDLGNGNERRSAREEGERYWELILAEDRRRQRRRR